MNFGVIGGGSWATAIVKILTTNHHHVHWWMRSKSNINHIQNKGNNPSYLPNIMLPTKLIDLTNNIQQLVSDSDILILVVPSAYVEAVLKPLKSHHFYNKYIVSCIKGIIPERNQLIHNFLYDKYTFKADKFLSILGPCHSEEVAGKKLSYLTVCGKDKQLNDYIADSLNNHFIKTRQTTDYIGTQFASILKNIYALASGIAIGLGYGDNFLSVFIANCTREMFYFLKTHPVVKQVENLEGKLTHSVYIGDFLVTAYSKYSRNREFGYLIGKGNTPKQATAQMTMTAEGYFTSKNLYESNLWEGAELPILSEIYDTLWKHKDPAKAFETIEQTLI